MARAPILVFGWGNPSRGDDALGPLFVERAASVSDAASGPPVEYLTDYQLQVEHALDLSGRERVLFVDASLAATPPFEVDELRAAPDRQVTTHAMSPSAVMQVFEDLYGEAPPPCTLLAIRGNRFELGEPPGGAARDNLVRALVWYRGWLTAGAGHDVPSSAACTS